MAGDDWLFFKAGRIAQAGGEHADEHIKQVRVAQGFGEVARKPDLFKAVPVAAFADRG